MSAQDDPVAAAARRIAAVLRDLEAETQQIVRAIGLQSVDMTRIDDYRPRWLRSVSIQLWPLPASEWNTEEPARTEFVFPDKDAR